MESVAGIFDSRREAERAFSELKESPNFERERLLLLTPDTAAEKIDEVPTDEGEQPGMGATIGGVIGGAVGLANGVALSNLVDEMFFYEDALRCGRSVVIANAESENGADAARSIMERNHAESVDAAREKWWIGIRDRETDRYCGAGPEDTAERERIFRAGFEAALPGVGPVLTLSLSATGGLGGAAARDA
ncbi:MAG: hypothetical protein ACREQ2_04215 [Candidatus Binatia bacterium]